MERSEGGTMEEREEKKGFTIRDRRVSTQAEEPETGERSGTEIPKEEGREERSDSPPIPDVDFSSFVFSLSTSVLLHLGEVPDPVTKKKEKHLPLAKQTIDILGMLQEKTRGNLTAQEKDLIDHLLADLRWRYIREVKG